MKKILSLLLALAMMLGCVAFAEGVDYVGTWVLTGAESDGVQMGPSTLAAIGMDMKVVVNADGTVTLSMMGMEEGGTWAATENGIAITDSTETVEIAYQNEMLLMNQSGVNMMLTREGAAPAIAEAEGATALAGVDPAAFEGQWLLTTANVMGMEMPVDGLGLYMALVLSQGDALFATTDDNGEIVSEKCVYIVKESENGTVVELYTGRENETSYEQYINAPSDECSVEFLYAIEMRKIIEETVYDEKSNVYGKIGRTQFADAMNYLVPEGIEVYTRDFDEAIERVDRYMENGIRNFYDDLVSTGHIVDGYVNSTVSDMADSLGITESYLRALIAEINLYYEDENKFIISNSNENSEGELILALKMLSDGRLNWSLDMDGLIVEYYFTKQVAE